LADRGGGGSVARADACAAIAALAAQGTGRRRRCNEQSGEAAPGAATGAVAGCDACGYAGHDRGDGTRKWLLDVGNGNAVDAVFIPEDDRGTLCVSSQAGCALDCAFCSTGKQGFNRNLTAAEIVGQLRHANRTLLSAVRTRRGSKRAAIRYQCRNDGMGEPLANFDNVVTAMRLMLDDNAYGLSRRRVTLSTRVSCQRLIVCAMRARSRSQYRCTRRTMRCATTGADQPQVSAAGLVGGVQPIPRTGAARLHHFRVRHARRRQ
jgi:hypothetical protein